MPTMGHEAGSRTFSGAKRQPELKRSAKTVRAPHKVKILYLAAAAVTLLVVVGCVGGFVLPSIFAPPSQPDGASESEFVHTRRAQIRIPYQGNRCREVYFSNETGRFLGDAITSCDTPAGEANQPQISPAAANVREHLRR